MSFRLDVAILVQTVLRMVNSSYVTCALPELDVAPKVMTPLPWDRVSSLIVKWRKPMIVGVDIALIVAANYLAFVLGCGIQSLRPPLGPLAVYQYLGSAEHRDRRLNEHNGVLRLDQLGHGYRVSSLHFHY
jgi:hypothetical protein